MLLMLLFRAPPPPPPPPACPGPLSQVLPAPGPEEVNWQALWSGFSSRDLRHNFIVRPLVVGGRLAGYAGGRD